MHSTAPSIYDFSARLLTGEDVSLGRYRGQVILIVNTASQCGFTPQYAGLKKLHQQYGGRGLAVLGFPCNQFGHQEPGTDEEIGNFCRSSFGIGFPIFSKIDVNGPSAHPLFAWLRKHRPGLFGLFGSNAIRWNFTKFLVGRDGRVVARYAPATKPEKIAGHIEDLLSESAA